VERLVEPGHGDLRFEGVFLSAERVAVDGDVYEPERVDPVVLRVPRTDDETRAGGEYGLSARDVLADLSSIPPRRISREMVVDPAPGMRSTSQSGTIPASRTSTTSAGSPWAAAAFSTAAACRPRPLDGDDACLHRNRSVGTGKRARYGAGDAER